MVSYIVRRLLLIPITLFGITVMVFLIARFAPGRPGQMQMADASLDAEQQQALAEWYEERYGLDDPLWKQYLNWWAGMFTADVAAPAWYGEDTLRPVQTLRSPDPEYFVRTPEGEWFVATNVRFAPGSYRVDDEAFLEMIPEEAVEMLPAPREGYPVPTHVVVEADLTPIGSLDEDRANELITRAEDLERVRVTIDAPAWTDEGEPLYVNPADPERPLFRRNGLWFAMDPTTAVARSPVYPITDEASLQPRLGGRYDELPPQEEGYAIPRHALVFGVPNSLEPQPDLKEEDLTRLTIPTEAASPSTMWVRLPGETTLGMLWQLSEPLPPLFVRDDDGSWHRLVGETRARPVPAEFFLQADPAFRSRLPQEMRALLPERAAGEREPRHAVMSGELVPVISPPSERRVRRYQAPDTIFEVTLGESIQTGSTVMEELERRLKVTLMISLIAFPLIYLIALPTGMLMAVLRGKFFDSAANVILLALWSIPTVLSATLLIGYLAEGGTWLELFPSTGLDSVGSNAWSFSAWLGDRAWHLVLPVLCITYGGLAYLAKQMRAAMLDNFTMDYVRTARAKGVPGREIVFRHVLRNSLLPIITIFATILPVLIAGSIIIETIFGIEGMGRLAFRAVQSRDYDVVQSLALIAGVLNLTGLLIADICYAIADPRITYS